MESRGGNRWRVEVGNRWRVEMGNRWGVEVGGSFPSYPASDCRLVHVITFGTAACCIVGKNL